MENKKLFITKYALSKGIMEKECEIRGNYAYTSEPSRSQYVWRQDNSEWHYSIEEAKIQAERMRVRAIARLNKQMQGLLKLRF